MRVSLAKAPLRLLLVAAIVLAASIAWPVHSSAQGQGQQAKNGQAGKARTPQPSKPSTPAGGGGTPRAGEEETREENPVPELECNRKHPKLKRVGQAAVKAKTEPTKPIEFSVRETNPILNFGSKRGVQANYIVLSTSEPIPEGVYSKNFEIDSLEPLSRITTGGLESVHLDPPTYTRPHIFNHRREIAFNLCISGRGGEPGSYNGKFQFVGPGSIATATLTQTAQLKAETGTFNLALAGVFALALVLLAFTAFYQSEGGWSIRQWLARIVIIVLSLVSTLLAMLVAYSENPTWGENLWIAVGALIATAFSAAGLGNTITAAAEKITTDKDDKPATEAVAKKAKGAWGAAKGAMKKLTGKGGNKPPPPGTPTPPTPGTPKPPTS